MKRTPEQIIEIIDEPKGWLKLTPSNIRDLSDYCKNLKSENEQLILGAVVGRSEQLVCVGCGRTEKQHTGNGKDICPNNGGQFKAN